jgi:hypothetical protein
VRSRVTRPGTPVGPEQRNSRAAAEEAAADRGDPVGESTAEAAEASAPVDAKPRRAAPRLAKTPNSPRQSGEGVLMSVTTVRPATRRTTTLADSPRWVSGTDSQKPVRGAPPAEPAGNKAGTSAAAAPMSATSRALLVKRPGAYFAAAPMQALRSGRAPLDRAT